MARMLRPLQNSGRSGTKRTSERVGHRARDVKNKQKSPQQLPGQRFLLRAHGNEVLERSGTDFCQVWTSPGRLLGGSWALLGRSRVLLATSWAHLGHIFSALGPLFAANCCPRWARARFFIDLGWILAPFGAPFGGSIWGRRASFLGRTLTSCRRIYMVRKFLQETHIEIHSGFSFSPCSAAVRAQHME